jgi:two-component system response regulator YesN
VQYIHEHLFEPGLNASVARLQCGLRDNNVASLFRHQLGCSIKEYIEVLRMKAARRLLEDERFSIFEIGQSLGYEHPQTFYRVFRRQFGCPPAAGRRPSERQPGNCAPR